MENTYTPREEWSVVISNIPIDGLLARAPPEERIIPIHGRCGSGQVSSISKPRLRIDHLVEQPSGLWEVRLNHGVPRAEKVEKDQMFDHRELCRRGIAEEATF